MLVFPFFGPGRELPSSWASAALAFQCAHIAHGSTTSEDVCIEVIDSPLDGGGGIGAGVAMSVRTARSVPAATRGGALRGAPRASVTDTLEPLVGSMTTRDSS